MQHLMHEALLPLSFEQAGCHAGGPTEPAVARIRGPQRLPRGARRALARRRNCTIAARRARDRRARAWHVRCSRTA
jgi:hypothetical protein